MSETKTQIPHMPIEPTVVYGEGVEPSLLVDPKQAAETMHQLGILPEAVQETTIYIGGKNNVARKGLQILKSHDRRIHGGLERNQGEGSVIRVNAKLRGKQRSAIDMNETLVHELEHVAQTERKDRNLKLGNLAIWGLASTGLVLGSKLAGKTGNKSARVGLALFGAAAGHDLGYMIAPHEIQARARAKSITSTAIQRK